jgi:hypothetical protein
VAGLPVSFVLALAFLGLLLTAVVIPAPFTVDDNNYLVNVLALRQGRVTIANTEGLTPSRELLFFDPSPWSRRVDATPVASTAPPLYAPIALAFSLFKWRGLVALNTLAYLLTTALVFLYTRRHSTSPVTPWLAAAAFAVGSFAIEYALGLWPHSLSVALVFSAVFLAGRAIHTGAVSPAAAAGFLLAVAAGVRYQNAVVLLVIGGALLLWGKRRWRMSVAYALCAAFPLTVSSVINHARQGSWNPISKGQNYFHVPAVDDAEANVTDPLVLLWAQVVDYTARPPLSDPSSRAWLTYEPVSGAHLMLGLVQKKSLLQSAPWIIVALAGFLASWTIRGAVGDDRRRQLQLMSLVVGGMLGVFALAGMGRHDGLSFNQRYLLEVLPFAAVAFGWSMDRHALPSNRLVAGGILGAAIVMLTLLATPVDGASNAMLWSTRHVLLAWVPLVIAALIVSAWILARHRLSAWLPLAPMVGLSLGWAVTVHLADDVVASNLLRRHNYERFQIFSRILPNPSALVVYWANRDAAVQLLFDFDIVILDAGADDASDAPALIRELQSRGRRVFLVPFGFTPSALQRIQAGFVVERVPGEALDVLELKAGTR